MIFKIINKIHFVGIGGIGMSAIAEVLFHQGFQISGSDRELNDVTERLSELGMEIFEGHSSENVKDVDVLVYSAAVSLDNPEVQAAMKKNIPIVKRSEMLAETMRMKYGIGVAGTHGKTTTTSMIGLTLVEAGLDPTMIVGGKLNSLNGSNARLGNGELIVVEADEFDRTFLKLNPVIAVLTSLEAEHLDTYKDLDDIKSAFTEYANKVPFYGFVAVCIDDPELRNISSGITKRVIKYGLSNEADVQAVDVQHKEFNSSYKVKYFEKEIGKIVLGLQGEHNVKNSLAAVTVGMELGIDFEIVKQTLKSFKGAQRRFEIKYNKEVLVIDDYAHHPTEAAETLKGIRSSWNRRLVAIFQPHLYSRTRDFYKDFGKSFLNSDVFICTDVYPARELPIEGISGKLIADSAVESGHKQVLYVADKNDIPDILMNTKQDGDIIITMGAGDIYKYGDKFVSMLMN
ncbi:MAG: UDP-N-acetylmuramate--L-alanine ligase [Ignavibacteriaceae bacterium]|nr:UDP-N-acetylmuramate--L-alanine ligase [Ignavibacteriaceae bacterium]